MSQVELQNAGGQLGGRSRTRTPRLHPADDVIELAQVGLRVADAISAMVMAAIAQADMALSLGVDAETALSIILALAICIGLGHVLGTYSPALLLRRRAQLVRAALTCAAIAAGEVALVGHSGLFGQIVGKPHSFGAFSMALGIGLLAFIGVRVPAINVLTSWARGGQLVKRVAIVSPDGRAEELVGRLARPGQLFPVEVVGVFKATANLDAANDHGVGALATLARNGHVDEVMLTGAWKDPSLLMKVADHFSWLPVTVGLCPEVPEPYRVRPVLLMSGGLPALAVFKRPLTAWQRALKRAEDLALAVPLLVLLLPLMAVCALFIKLDSPGPVLYRQKRYGFNHEPITVYKFRTMRYEPEASFSQATRNDPRVTRVGWFLRRTSLDELPQLFNVLEGSMSLVGPRPHPIPLDEAFAPIISNYFVRHRMKPGITGWAQINGFRGETNAPEKMAKRIELDIFYVENWSILFDLKILVRTALVGFIHPNAY